ncbi:RNA-binding protein FUS-like isoform X2 [Tenebrio molitor]|uniref:RNA-binding protein FUS-like isoform X2 n=1 Tax=Tenebrio molitor TaxID=7067 RepID=UPI0036248127
MCTIMFATLILITTLGTSLAGYAGSSSNDVSSGYGYGYSGSYSGNGGNIPPPSIPNIPNFDFGGLLNGYFDSFKKYHEHFINTLQQQAAQAAAQNPGYAAGFSSYGAPQGGSYSGGAGDGGGAVASASLGPQGGYQTAAVYPENPNAPNIFSRFGETSGGDGTYGVFTSSVSSSSNVDGKPQNFHRASTTINDNGKISTYTVKNP